MAAPRAAIYTRVSTGAQESDGTSLVTQEERCRAYAAERGYQVATQHVYQEVHTGVELWERPALTRLREAVRRQDVEVLVAYAIDRLARDPVHLGVIITEADYKGVRVEFVSEPLDASPEGQLIRFVRGYAAQVEHAKIVERSRRGWHAKVAAGKVPGNGGNLFGYTVDRERWVRAVCEPEAAVVRTIFRMYVDEALSIREVAARLTAQGVPAPAARRGGSPEWQPVSVRRILRHEAYVGESYAHKFTPVSPRARTYVVRPRADWITLSEASTPALIDRETWDAAARRLASNTGAWTRNERHPWLLRGLVVCAVCERKCWTFQRQLAGRPGTYYYRCSSIDARASCGARPAARDALEAWAWAAVAERLANPALIEQERLARRPELNDGSVAAELRAARKRMTQLVAGQERLLARYSESESVPWELVEREIARAEREKTGVQTLVAGLERRLAERETLAREAVALAAYCATVAANLATLTFAERRRTLDVLGVRVLIGPAGWHLTTDPEPF